MSSVVEIALLFISYARWVSIMLTNSSTTFTLELSSEPWINVPAPLLPGVSTCAEPLAAVSR